MNTPFEPTNLSDPNDSCDAPTPPLATINMVPLIDVMLVLLVIFMVTTPLLTQTLNVALPRATNPAAIAAAVPKPPLEIGIDRDGTLYWHAEPVDRQTLQERLRLASQQPGRTAIRIQADRATPYEKVAQVMADAARTGMDQIGFVTLTEVE